MRLLNFLILSIGMAFTACQPAPETITSEDYQRAERFLTQNTDSLVYGNVKQQAWQANNTLYYSVTTKNGVEYLKVNPTGKEILPAFDQQKLAEKLVSLTKTEIHPYDMALSAIAELEEGAKVQFRFSGNDYELSLSDYTLIKQSPKQKRNEILSPDGRWAAYIDSYNLWVRNTSTDERVQLTFDGIKDYGYATDNAGWTHGDNPVLLWSPQSDKIATFRHD
ncbi:MAG: DPP IV N-terminal domain-containing protein, partial [Cyclobacteriaceae bacterium]|nr:DPP IV N-terminal domain-containing protein [Cyclobacteriaceae bacterium]